MNGAKVQKRNRRNMELLNRNKYPFDQENEQSLEYEYPVKTSCRVTRNGKVKQKIVPGPEISEEGITNA